jgi:hypothetical protein
MTFKILLFLFFLTTPVYAEFSNEEIVTAIKKIENSRRHPYGIVSVRCSGDATCRQVCLRTVKNNRHRFSKNHGDAKDFINFLAKRYCPVGAKNDPHGLNKNWEPNMRKILAQNRRTK